MPDSRHDTPARGTRILNRPAEEREFLIWLRMVEKRAILPLKWAIFATALVFWVLSHRNSLPPPVDVYTLFVLYLMFTIGQSYFFWFSRVSLSQVQSFSIVSYCVDVLFVTVLVYFDASKYVTLAGPVTDFYIFYFLLILRGFPLFRTPRENLMANVGIGTIFIISILWQDTTPFTYSSQNNMIRIIFIWLVILMSWFIVEIINRQKDEIMRARENLILSENMTVLGELAAGVAHEINNPIGIITAYAEYLKKNCAPGDPHFEDFDTIHKEARRCENIVAELLSYARPAASSKLPTDLRKLNDEVLEFLFRRTAREEVQITKEYAENVPMLTIDANQIKQALMNIYLNARQAMTTPGGQLKITIKADLEKNMVRQKIEDNGCGISPEELKRVFDPFFTTRPKGTGLGLAITKRILESHGGVVMMESQPGKGTSVEVAIPYDQTVYA